MEKPQLTLEQAAAMLRGNEYFDAILTDIVEERETAIAALATYKDTTELMKLAAEITEKTSFLDRFGVPTGSPISGA